MNVLHRARDLAHDAYRRLPFVGPPKDHAGPLPYVLSRPSVRPILPVADMAAASDFYRRLGFQVVAHDDGYARVEHCGWEYLHLRRVDDAAGNQASAYVHVDDADVWHAAMAAASNGDIDLGEPADMPWGMREFTVTDPCGNHVRFGHNL